MATIPYKLEDITSEYSLFLDNQVLTAKQLNEIVHYFEDQQRLSRILLSGVGRACGFELKWKSGAGSLELSCGVGVTTDGDLMYLNKTSTLTQFKAFTDENARYPLFYQGESQFELWELYEDNAAEEEVPELSSLSGFQEQTGVHPNELAVILYVEHFDKAPDICTKLDCDNLGNRQVNNIHVLLIKKTDLESIINNADTIFKTCRKAGNHFFDLPKLAAPRIMLNASRSKSFSALANAYASAIKNQLGTVQSAITTLLSGFKWLLDPKNQTSNSALQARMVQIFSTDIAKPDIDIQYRYDLLKDVIATYSELRSMLWDLCMNCCPDTQAFPKHLMIRELVVTDDAQAQYRHHYYPSAATASEREDKIFEVKALYRRLVSLIFNYRKRFNVEIKVTPSRMPLVPLGKRAIPFYVDSKLHEVWDGEHMRFQREDEQLSYLAPSYAGLDSVKNPLLYDIDAHDFFRIEGHVGQSFNAAITEISNKIQEYQLPVEVIGLRLGDVADSINIDEYECYFEDLLVILKAWQEEQKCIWSAISRFFSGFNLRTPETHIEYGSRKIEAEKEKSTSGNKEMLSVAGSEKEILKKGATENYLKYSYPDIGISEYRYAGNPVEENLVTEENYIGSVIEKVIKQNASASYAEIKDVAIQEIEKIPEVKEWDSEVYEMAVDIPVNMLALAYEVNMMKPANIAELNVEVLDNFQVSMERICKNIKTWQSAIGKKFYKTGYSRVGYEDRYEQLLSQVAVNCCAADRLEVLRDEIERRKLKILEMTMLSKYVEKHPGMEHMAGVPRGGTFILVYKGQSIREEQKGAAATAEVSRKERVELVENKEVEKRKADKQLESLRKMISQPEMKMMSYASGASRYGPSMGIEELQSALANKDFNRIEAYVEAILAEQASAEIPVGDFQVVADFALPYLCCSDCPPMSFIVPKERVSLIAPNHICFVEGMDPVALTVVPADGEVKTDQGANLVRKDEGGQWVFDPNGLSLDLFGTPIGFTVNDQITEARTIVFHQPQPEIELQKLECNVEKGVAIATFENKTPQVEGVDFTYEWNFGDGTIEANSSLLVTHVYRGIKPNVTQSFEVILKASNRLCTASTDPLKVDVLCEVETPEEPKCLEVASDNYLKIKEMFASIEVGDFQNISELHKLTQEIFNIVDRDFEQVYKGAFNANFFPQLISLMNDTQNMLLELEKEREVLAQLLRVQLMLLLSVLRCQDLDITEEQKELFTFFRNLPELVGRLIEIGINLDEGGSLAEYITDYLDAIEGDRGIFREVLVKVLELLKQ